MSYSVLKKKVQMERVPPELVDAIIELLDKASLLKCTLVCHLWSELAKAYVYKSISLDEGPREGHDFHSFSDFLESTSSVNVARHVKALGVSGSQVFTASTGMFGQIRPIPAQNLSLTASDIDRLLSRLPLLESLSLNALVLTCSISPPEHGWSTPRRLKRLQLRMVQYSIVENTIFPVTVDGHINPPDVTYRCGLIETLNLFSTVQYFKPIRVVVLGSKKYWTKDHGSCIKWAKPVTYQLSDAFNVEGLRLFDDEDSQILLALLRSSPRCVANLRVLDGVTSDMQPDSGEVFNQAASSLRDVSVIMGEKRAGLVSIDISLCTNISSLNLTMNWFVPGALERTLSTIADWSESRARSSGSLLAPLANERTKGTFRLADDALSIRERLTRVSFHFSDSWGGTLPQKEAGPLVKAVKEHLRKLDAKKVLDVQVIPGSPADFL
ncbi:hypothetical protein EIP91_010694 [Steccherinum ochraceum]|uniref:F-box domain-containing protein n=1 Tax=Steccherinum ochraceum TaxID=92696 RepID=A0A4R0R0B2_9APHY|nr:hypothetical protein EIP91_010694 [Steccherinum ochraceum]